LVELVALERSKEIVDNMRKMNKRENKENIQDDRKKRYSFN